MSVKAVGARVVGWLDRERAVQALLALNVLLALGAFVLLRGNLSIDHHSYWNLAMGLLQGKYSMWYFLDPYPADTMRTPGFPLFVALASLGGRSLTTAQLAQLMLHVASLCLALRLVRKLAGDAPIARVIFLLLVIPNAQLLHYLPAILPETLMVFLVTLYLTLELEDPADNLWRHAGIGLLLGVCALVRPVAVLVPFARFAFVRRPDHRRARFLGAAISVLVTLLCMLPYGVWNAQVHHKFSIMPIEGSSPNREMGFWQHRLPDQPTHRFWRDNWMGNEVVYFIDPADLPRNIAEYHAQWDRIDAAAEPFLSERDRARLPVMRAKPELFLTFEAPYTFARSQAIEKELAARIREAPGYYLTTRLYSAVRLWVTGVNRARFAKPGLVPKVVALYPTIASGVSFGLGLPFAAWAIARRRAARVSTLPFWLLGFVYWGAHVPMSIQSRYTVPLHVGALVLVATALAAMLRPGEDGGASDLRA